jgi:hypothetical protein
MRAHSRLVLASFLVLGAAFAALSPGTAAAAAPLRLAASGTPASGTPVSAAASGGDLSLVYGTGFSAAGHLIEGSSATQAAIRDKLNRSTYSTVPFWASSFDSGGTSYPFFMVGNSPSHPGTTVVPTVLIPIDLTFQDNLSSLSSQLDGSVNVPAILHSPVFQAATFPATGDTTQYADAVTRAEWSGVLKNAQSHHVLLGTPTVLPAVQLTVPAGAGALEDPGDGIPHGIIDSDSWWTDQITSLVSTLNISPEVLPIFVTYDMTAGLAVGFHGALGVPQPNGKLAISTYAWASWMDPGWFTFVGLGPYVGADVDVLSHEVNEWMNDPFISNIVPAWSYSVPPLITNACSNLLETGDPLELVNFPVPLNGFTYHLQDAAFFSYFARQSPSIGYQGRYTFLGTLPSYSTPC